MKVVAHKDHRYMWNRTVAEASSVTEMLALGLLRQFSDLGIVHPLQVDGLLPFR